LSESSSSEDDDTGDELIPNDDSASDIDYEAPSDDDLDFVSHSLDSTFDSDEPLSVHVNKTWNSNAPGTPDFRWRRRENVPRKYSFSGTPGVKVDLAEDSSPLAVYREFITDELIDFIVEETNRYVELIRIAFLLYTLLLLFRYSKVISVPTSPNALHFPTDRFAEANETGRRRRWTPITSAELHVYLGLRLLMGINKKPRLAFYWSRNPGVAMPIFPSTMPRERFEQISRNLHFQNNEGQLEEDDRLWKLREVITILGDRFRKVFTPDRHISIDESLWKFRGRLSFRTYNPSKRARFGIKVYKLSASDGPCAGYTAVFKIYTGKEQGSLPSSQKAVVDLMEEGDFFWKGYTVFVDNWYTSPVLFHFLQSRKTGAVGTVRLNRRHMPRDLKVRKRGDVDSRSSPTGMLALSWMDVKQVNMLSTVHTSHTVEVLRRGGSMVSKPECVVAYNDGMKGVDLGDQLAQSYPSVRRSLKWYKKIFFYIYDLATVNSHSVYKYLGNRCEQIDFRLDLAMSIINSFLPDIEPYSARGRPSTLPSPSRFQGRTAHIVRETPGRKYRRCFLCYRAGRRKMTRTVCPACEVSLCTYGCFEKYHSQKHLT